MICSNWNGAAPKLSWEGAIRELRWGDVNSGCFSFPCRSEFTSRDSQNSDKQILNIYDLCNKFIAYSAGFEDIVDVLAEWGSLYVLTRDGRVHALQEKDTQTKLEARPPGSKSWHKHLEVAPGIGFLGHLGPVTSLSFGSHRAFLSFLRV